ncbi:1263_t:CDS:2, partial [Paraglomus occultum]
MEKLYLLVSLIIAFLVLSAARSDGAIPAKSYPTSDITPDSTTSTGSGGLSLASSLYIDKSTITCCLLGLENFYVCCIFRVRAIAKTMVDVVNLEPVAVQPTAALMEGTLFVIDTYAVPVMHRYFVGTSAIVRVKDVDRTLAIAKRYLFCAPK